MGEELYEKLEHGTSLVQSMDQTGASKMLRDEITDATAAIFAGATVIPDRYVQSDEIARGGTVINDESCKISLPVIDMAKLLDESQEEIAKLGSACRDWGFFQIINHGVDEAVVDHVKDNTIEFFKLPLEKKKAVGTIKADGGFQGYGHHFNKSTGKLEWAESLLLLGVQPIQIRNMDFWPTDPPAFRDILDKYSLEMTKLASLLMAAMAIDLGVKRETLMETIEGKLQNIIFHHYPPCHHGADKVVGIASHTDSFCLTAVLQVDTTPGLQVIKDGKWFLVRPLPGSFTIFVGDILEVLTNGRYKSVEHRAVVHPERGRTTIVTFQDACVDGVVKPLPGLGEEERYKSIKQNDCKRHQLQALEEGGWFIDSLKI